MQRIPIPIPGHEHDVLIGRGLLGRPDLWLPPSETVTHVALVTDERVGPIHATAIEQALKAAGVPHSTITVPEGECSKSLPVLGSVYSRFVAAGLDRQAVVAAVGGGVVGDLAGFAAATYLRGLRLIQIPTTLLAQVDSSVGGKTGIDLEEGKNLVGAFHQPTAVAVDLDTLRTLPHRQLQSGLAEVVKYGVIADPTILSTLEAGVDTALSGDAALLADLVARSIRIKAEVVVGDERESGRRAILNFGHTFGHALESTTGYRTYLHGEAISVGMVYALRLSSNLMAFEVADALRVTRLLAACGLPIAPREPIDPDGLMMTARADKKTLSGHLRFVLVRALGEAELVPVKDDDARRVLEATT